MKKKYEIGNWVKILDVSSYYFNCIGKVVDVGYYHDEFTVRIRFSAINDKSENYEWHDNICVRKVERKEYLLYVLEREY